MTRDISTGKKVILIIVGVILFGILFSLFFDVERLLELILGIKWSIMLVGSVAFLAGTALSSVRLRYILLNLPKYRLTFYANSIGYLLHIGMFVPGMVSRAVAVGTITDVSVPRASSGLLIERIFEQVMRVSAGLLVIVLFTTLQTDKSFGVGGAIFLLAVMIAVMMWVINNRDLIVAGAVSRLGRIKYLEGKDIRGTASSMLDGLEAVSSPRRLIVTLFLSYATWICFLAFYTLALLALPYGLLFQEALLVAALLLAVAPPSINVMWLVYHFLVIAPLVLMQFTSFTEAALLAIILHLIQLLYWTALGSWSMARLNLSIGKIVDQVRHYASSEIEDAKSK